MEWLLFGVGRNLDGMTRVLISDPSPRRLQRSVPTLLQSLPPADITSMLSHPSPPSVLVRARPAAADYHAVHRPLGFFFLSSTGRLPALRQRASKGDCRLAGHPIILRVAALQAEVRLVRSVQALFTDGIGARSVITSRSNSNCLDTTEDKEVL